MEGTQILGYSNIKGKNDKEKLQKEIEELQLESTRKLDLLF